MKSTAYAAALACGYFTLAVAWIVTSSRLAAANAGSLEDLERFEVIKGALFMLCTSTVIFFGGRFALRRIEAAGESVLHRERVLHANERRVFAGLLAASIAHDANNVLAVVLSELELLRGVIPAETLERLQASVAGLAQLNRRVVEMGRQVTQTKLEVMDLGRAVREAVDLVRHHEAVRHAQLQVVDEGPVTALGHSLLVSQVVTNLVLNAGEAAQKRGKVDVRVRRCNGAAVIEVDDDGPGIPPERRRDIFDALVTTKPDGNGLGLFSVKAAARALGGAVSVDASPRGGARFRVEIPLSGP